MLVGAGLKRSGHKREEILGSARAHFLREGYADTGMEAIARAAGISTATLYAYFPSKAHLFRTIVMETVSGIAAPVREAVRVKGHARARLIALSTAYATFFSRPDTRAMFRMATTERRRFPEVADYFLQSARDELGGAAIAVINDLVKTGELKVDKPSWAAGQLLGMLDHVTLVLGLAAGDDVQSRRSVRSIADDAVETFLARYGAR
ncbi:TetR/AcrR family transcriptional regulator [Caulobacter vibrioides]|uniref:Transcriptional regulator, TetR family n=2 Tax=Caulobacter vibrioides TaxID=155892 RepID=Q9A9Q5_CAUVC|nr:TetR/AcrR family transcriptional regulator [Caulobacter vibrioides]YP_002516340.1 TetR-family transcriptional regulator [Caulobacter vibrioides NA1000]AAK22903.1 transcriptional regulator, TetR family [Caulobacter vibrioides CB15]ACL94432.1 TetR-family transcriptional regulator [Caulobacter vibrioides NA1000]ATC27755.1 TetR/AcrR family transcriptional regulator [Caulobacter vibrioides]QXZ52996.1 TetR/AcrR family transcriptional regulator [Caulobacter vibrioides]